MRNNQMKRAFAIAWLAAVLVGGGGGLVWLFVLDIMILISIVIAFAVLGAAYLTCWAVDELNHR